jgi:hypothetical protein
VVAMILDVEKYLPYLADTGLSEEQKLTYITEVWNFLDRFFTHDLKKRVTENSGHTEEFNLQSPAPLLDSKGLKARFTQCANDNETPIFKGRAHG